MPDKPDQTPWESEPYRSPENYEAATERAIAGAVWHAPGRLTPVQQSYADKAFTSEIEALKSTGKGGRNRQLNSAAFALAQFVAAGALDETTVRADLEEACRINGHYQEDGAHMVLGTIESGFEGGLRQPRDLSHVTGQTNGYLFADEPVKLAKLDDIVDIEAGFWTKRESLKTIYLAALSRMSSPWAVLGYCAARALTLVRPNATLPPLIGGPGSLNWFAAIAAPSGGGKGSAASCSKQLVDEIVMSRNLGSGEGLIDAYVKPANKETGEPKGLHEAIMFVSDEIDTMHALTMRSGATLSSILRSAFNGETIGFSYRTASSLHLLANSYRMTLVVNVPPAKAGALLDDSYGGTLQRFMWFPGKDKRVDPIPPLMPAPLEMPSHTRWQYDRELTIPYTAKYLILTQRAKDMRDEIDAIDGHQIFIREKFAFALAVLDGRDVMDEEDWRLAGIASRVSDHTRNWVTAQLQTALQDEAAKRGTLQGHSSAAAEEAKAHIAQSRINRVAKWALGKIEAADDMSQRELDRAVSSRDRPYLKMAIEHLQAAGLIQQDDNKHWVRTDV